MADRKVQIWNDNNLTKNYELYFVRPQNTAPDVLSLAEYDQALTEHVHNWQVDFVGKNYVDAGDENLQTQINNHEERITDIEAEQIVQNTRLDTIEAEQVVQNTRLDDIEAKNIEQDNRLDAIDGLNGDQQGRLDLIEEKNEEQDLRLDDHEDRIVTIETEISDDVSKLVELTKPYTVADYPIGLYRVGANLQIEMETQTYVVPVMGVMTVNITENVKETYFTMAKSDITPGNIADVNVSYFDGNVDLSALLNRETHTLGFVTMNLTDFVYEKILPFDNTGTVLEGTEENPIIMSLLDEGFYTIKGVTISNTDANSSSLVLNEWYPFSVTRNANFTYCSCLRTNQYYLYTYPLTGSNVPGEGRKNSLTRLMLETEAQTVTALHQYTVLPRSTVTPTNNADLVNKAYVDSLIGSGSGDYVKKSGDTMNGELGMNGNRITDVDTPIMSEDVANKNYVDEAVRTEQAIDSVNMVEWVRPEITRVLTRVLTTGNLITLRCNINVSNEFQFSTDDEGAMLNLYNFPIELEDATWNEGSVTFTLDAWTGVVPAKQSFPIAFQRFGQSINMLVTTGSGTVYAGSYTATIQLLGKFQ